MSDPADRAARLLRWYPRSWRDRYGEEFAELLTAEAQDRPRCWRRSADVAVHGLLARLACAGLTSRVQPPAARLAAVAGALAAFTALAIAMLAQLATGWQWATPRSDLVTGATLVMAVAAAGIVLTGVGGLVPVMVRVLIAIIRRDRAVLRPAGLALAGVLTLTAGAWHFANSWPGTGGTGPGRAFVPGGLAAFGWSSTLSMSSFWAHPALLMRFPAGELAWMAASPLAAAVTVLAAGSALRRLQLPAPLTRYLARLAQAATVFAAVLLAGAVSWLLAAGAVTPGLFRPGLVDGAELLAMAGALAVAATLGRGLSRRNAATATGRASLT